MTDKLHHTQDLLYDSTRDYLELKLEHRNHEKLWVEEKEQPVDVSSQNCCPVCSFPTTAVVWQ
jgi:coiled-coil domain-containing protein 77